MNTLPCPRCQRQVLRDGTVGVLVCSCGQVLEFPPDPHGPGARPAPGDIRWYGTEEERADAAELGKPVRGLSKQETEYAILLDRVKELDKLREDAEEAGLPTERDLAIPDYQRRRQELEKE